MIITRTIIILLLLHLNILIIGVKAEGNVTLKIIGMDLKPIKGAQVRVADCDEAKESNADGLVEILLCRKKCIVVVRHPNYFEQERILNGSDAGKIIEIKLMPLIKQTEELIVSATRYPERGIEIPAIENVLLASEVGGKEPANIEAALNDAIGVTSIGSGGYSKALSIRGLARKRVLLLVDNARINSDRRTGPSASFVMPEDIESIEMIRNSSSALYGSDAIGGVIHLIMKKPDLSSKFKGKVRMKYGFNNKEKQAGVSLNFAKENSGLYVSLQGIDAENYKNSKGQTPDSYFSSYGVFSKYLYLNDERGIEFSLLINRGIDIGKPSKNSLQQPTWYPKETHNLFNFYWQENLSDFNKFNFRFFLDPNKLETQKDTVEGVDRIKTKESVAINESTDYGLQFAYLRLLNEKAKISIGLDNIGRIGVNAYNTDKKYDSEGNLIKTSFYSSIRDGKRNDYGIFVSFDSEWENLNFNAGVRYDYFKLSAEHTELINANKFKSDALTGFAAVLYKFPTDIIFISRIGHAYRLPCLSERFYVGITGRGQVIGNPNLAAEKSINFDMGVKVAKKNFYAGVYGFYYKIDDMVERYNVSSTVYTYDNIESGVIKGFEGEIDFYPIQ